MPPPPPPLPEDLIVGDPLIDEQHYEFFQRVEEFHAAVHSRTADPVFLRSFMGYLLDYAVRHFRAEEKVMWEVRYPGTKQHRQEHLAFWRSCLAIQEACEANGYAPACATQLVERVTTWLAEHIEREDRSFIVWTKAKRDGLPDSG